ncbi:bifunctional proline dehydrogenase/L-glutamate gamma-semialdehyde dehydrogenase PutA [Paracoccus siganidrum]|uniref:Bifunctional protein PutA n=1 Tax=Paracoccus siganidrum TaxID=1276757 RepID=A0A419A9F6_9RHOB|nr:bifunctional proline dehydrogenase/L-glutamate gamma-semialdehyde dehydrogenase PutA [Paracoccus siganidrum]RJL19228.1 bifunctional proline dehydrogenase/L-glutamate gamma-semialdehyde dehydrogenase PutA [Paracoccus siganidrum]RMC39290.1 bifunctional proline dehydrogenase/L-glutamate gamma-semialdehyde dehydrogenase [Paracoccus siganidrum]
MAEMEEIRRRIRASHLGDETQLMAQMVRDLAPDGGARAAIAAAGADLVRAVRGGARPGLMEVFLAEYGLSTEEGVALMCLAEALLRVPDAATMDELIEDKIAPSEWGQHLGHSASPLVNASTWALMLTGKVLRGDETPGIAGHLRNAVRRLGEPVIRSAVHRAMREMGQQFVLGETMQAAIRRGRDRVAKGFTYSYDMLGEAARTASDAADYLAAYEGAIAALAAGRGEGDLRDRPGVSIKLSALHPRYEASQHDRVMAELAPVVLQLCRLAARAGMGLNIDAEEQDRLDLSLDVIQAVLSDPSLAGWDGFGVVVQAYGKRATAVIDWLEALAEHEDRRIMVRLVKGAYWDSEIKRAQVDGLAGFPVWTRKPATDVAWICCARKLLASPRIYPQFATHNAHSVAAILHLAGEDRDFEFQRLHGMGEALHDIVKARHGTRCRIYAPVGAHEDLLAYLVRRLLENGANSSFVNRIVDDSIPADQVAPDPFAEWDQLAGHPARGVRHPEALFAPARLNSRGFDLRDPLVLARIETARAPFATHQWQAAPILAAPDASEARAPQEVVNPARPNDRVGRVALASGADIEAALEGAGSWDVSPATRSVILRMAADLYEDHFGELFALLAREAGKALPDAVAELREAVDFLRYYAGFASAEASRGIFACISPWNFPLAIFTGQVAAALAAGNAVLAKPAEATSLIAHRATQLLHKAGVPVHALQLLPGEGARVGTALCSDPRVGGVCFTGSLPTAQAINRAMAANLSPDAPLIAETGGLNAMVVDSTALPEQAVRDILASAFQSAGQRCSALRMLYVQKDVEERLLTMLHGAMDELRQGDPWDVSTDIGPVISAHAKNGIDEHVTTARDQGRVLHRLRPPGRGHYVAPVTIRVGGIEDVGREVFGPVLHVARFEARDLDRVLGAINASGYGLTFGLHTRIDDRVQHVDKRLAVGNLYVNRNQIGAVVGSQPFGGEGLSGTGPKAGGPHYVPRFRAVAAARRPAPEMPPADAKAVQAALDKALTDSATARETQLLPGPTGESNRLTLHARGTVLCLGPDTPAQAAIAAAQGCAAVEVAGHLPADALRDLSGMALVAWDGPEDQARLYRMALAARGGPIVALVHSGELAAHALLERHLCIDTTASGGNASLLAVAG